MSDSDQKYWFPAKRYGWGWGFPSTWQGWAVFLAWLMAMTVLGILLSQLVLLFAGIAILLSAMLLAVAWIKGEPPRWRWGKG
ncbi:MAG: hypothetical protein AAF333_03670 [Planctomycetota bacterium]